MSATITRNDTIVFRIIRVQVTATNAIYRVAARIPGFNTAYLVKPEGDCSFPNRSAALKAAKRRAAALGLKAKILSTATVTTRKTAKR
jgi:hypothetical protein